MASSTTLFVVGLIACTQAAVVKINPESRRLIEFGPSDRRWVSLEEITRLGSIPGELTHFIDVTDLQLNRTAAPASSEDRIPNGVVHEDLVESFLDQLDTTGITATITHLASYTNRYYTQRTGREAVEWLEGEYKAASLNRADVVIELVEHSWEQPSLVVKVLGSSRESTEIIILGGHIDSTAGAATALAPGADDDASGSATVLEVFRTLMKNRFVPDRTIEFHAYAAEEAGLRGSAAVAEQYKLEGMDVVSMMQFDMVGYPADITTPMGLTTDFVSPVFTTFVGKLNAAYSAVPSEPSTCGYACSDHASWERNGYLSSFPFECKFGNHNPAIHSMNDVISRISIPRCNEFAKLGVGYIVEMSLVNSL